MTIYTRPDLFMDPTSTFGETLGKTLGNITPTALAAYQYNQQQQQLRQKLRELGVEEPLIDLYLSGSTGGQTDITKLINRSVERGALGGRRILPAVDEETQDPEQLVLNYEQANFGNLSPSEVAKTRSDLRKTNQGYFKDELKNVSTLREQNRSINLLTQLNERGNLPSGLMRLNVDNKTGALRLPFLASKDAQQYAKTLQSFLNGLKNTFGARITNLDVSLYVQGLPTLANSDAGRRVVLNQMRIANQINQTYYTALNSIYRRYGDRLSSAQIEYLAELQTREPIQQLENQYQQLEEERQNLLQGGDQTQTPANATGQTFEKLPSASKNRGTYIQDEETGDVFYSNGKNWKRVRSGVSNNRTSS